jgi:nicotinamidase-related amidase
VDPLLGPRFASSALVTIDLQADTLAGQPLEVAGTDDVVPRVAELCRAYRVAVRPIVHVVRLYLADGSNAEPVRREQASGSVPVLRPDTPGRLLAPGLFPGEGPELDDALLLRGGPQVVGHEEVVLYKPRWGAFFGTDLERHLRAAGVDTVVVAGCNFPNCPRTTIYEASERDFRVVLVADGVSGLYDRGCEELRGIGVAIRTTAEVVAALSTQAS